MRTRAVLAAATLVVGLGCAVRADQKLPPEQQAKAEAMPRQEGFTERHEIEMDDGMIEVDAAIDAAGKPFDLKLDPQTLAIVKRKAE